MRCDISKNTNPTLFVNIYVNYKTSLNATKKSEKNVSKLDFNPFRGM